MFVQYGIILQGFNLRWEFIKENKENAYDQESDQEKRNNDNGQEKKKENTLSTKKVRFEKKR